MSADAQRALPSAAADPLLGEVVGEYRVLERIGEGGMGIVYRAQQAVIGKEVALKVLRPEIARDPSVVGRLLGEGRAASAVHHRGIIDIFGFGHLPDGRAYLVMEHLRGAPLDLVMARSGRMGALEVVTILGRVMEALDAAHQAGVVHRDLKPSNVFLEGWPGPDTQVKVLDFGLAKELLPGRVSPQTTSFFAGTPSYISPEQVRGGPIGPEADLYSMGVVAFEMLTGSCPFLGSTVFDILDAHVRKPPPSLLELRPDVPEPLLQLIHGMLEKDPRARPRSAREIDRELGRIRKVIHSSETGVRPLPLDSPVAQPALAANRSQDLTQLDFPQGPVVRIRSAGRRRALVAGLAALAVLAGVGAYALRGEELLAGAKSNRVDPAVAPPAAAPPAAARPAAAPPAAPAAASPGQPSPPAPVAVPPSIHSTQPAAAKRAVAERPVDAPSRAVRKVAPPGAKARPPPPRAPEAPPKEPAREALRQRAASLRTRMAAGPRDVRAELFLKRAEQLIESGRTGDELRKASAMLDDLSRHFVR